MTREEFSKILLRIKSAYVQDLSFLKEDDRQLYFRGLHDQFGALEAIVFNKAVDRYISISKNAPKISDLVTIVNSIKTEQRKKQEIKTVSCKICGGVGLISYYRWNPKTGFWCEYLCHCTCRNNIKYQDSKTFITAKQVDEMMMHNSYIRLNVPYGMYRVPPKEFDAVLKMYKKPVMSDERAKQIKQEILSRREKSGIFRSDENHEKNV